MVSCSCGLDTVSWIFRSKVADISAAGQNLGQVESTDRQLSPGQGSAQLHETTGIDGHDRGGSSSQDRFDFRARHATRDFVELHRERASEAAALLGSIHLSQLETAYIA